MKDEKGKNRFKSRIIGALWGAFLGILLGTACSSVLGSLIQTEWLRKLLTGGVEVGIPTIETSLGFFNLTLGFSLRFTLLSGFFMLLVASLMLCLPFKNDK